MLGLSNRSTGKHSEKLKHSIGACYIALDRKKVEGRVSDRMVRATFSALERITPNLLIDHVPNPFPAPHNLSWYFGSCACPSDVRQFATRIRKQNSRVWSVAQDKDGWLVLVQVFGADTLGEATEQIIRDVDRPKKSLMSYLFDGVRGFRFSAENRDQFLHEHAKELLNKQGSGHFIEIRLRRAL